MYCHGNPIMFNDPDGHGIKETLSWLKTKVQESAQKDAKTIKGLLDKYVFGRKENTQSTTQNTTSQGELSGAQWCQRYPGSSSTETLNEPFQTNVNDFVSAVEDGGGNVSISSTYRPSERQSLMYWSYKIAEEGQNPETVPSIPGVNIQWNHGNNSDSVSAARAMLNGYGIVHRPGRTSNHTGRNAIDMNITWTGNLRLRNRSGAVVEINTTPRNNNNRQLWDVARTYDVIKFESDFPHWSSTGR